MRFIEVVATLSVSCQDPDMLSSLVSFSIKIMRSESIRRAACSCADCKRHWNEQKPIHPLKEGLGAAAPLRFRTLWTLGLHPQQAPFASSIAQILTENFKIFSAYASSRSNTEASQVVFQGVQQDSESCPKASV